MDKTVIAVACGAEPALSASIRIGRTTKDRDRPEKPGAWQLKSGTFEVLSGGNALICVHPSSGYPFASENRSQATCERYDRRGFGETRYAPDGFSHMHDIGSMAPRRRSSAVSASALGAGPQGAEISASPGLVYSQARRRPMERRQKILHVALRIRVMKEAHS
jgi:hypothetical protein